MAKQIAEFFNFEDLGDEYSRLIFACKNGQKISALSMGETERVAILAKLDRPILYLANDYISATKIHKQFEALFGGAALLWPVFIDNLFYKRAQSIEANISRIKTLSRLCQNRAKVIVASADSLIGFLPNVDDFKSSIVTLKKNETVLIDDLKKKLISLGYSRVELLAGEGQFASRGDIFDIFPSGSESAVRIEFWGDTIDSIKTLDLETQTSKTDLGQIIINPNTDLILTETEHRELLEKLSGRLNRAKTDLDPNSAIISGIEEAYSRLERGERDFSLDYLFPLLKHKASDIFDYLAPDTLIVMHESKMVYDGIVNSSSEIEMRFKNQVKAGEALEKTCSGYFSATEILNKINTFAGLVHQKITNSNRFFDPQVVCEFKSIPMQRYSHNFVELISDLKNWKTNGFSVFLLAGSNDRAAALSRKLEDEDVFIEAKPSGKLTDSGLEILPYDFSGGFILPDKKKVVISTTDLYAQRRAAASVSVNRKDVFSVPKVGDYVVHSVHGIGICEGVTNLSSNFGSKDYVVVKYRDNDTLYVPIDSLNMLERFSGAEAPKKLSKIGGVEFSKVKEKVKASVKKLAFDLTELYAKREAKRGFAFSKDNAMQREFENSFAHIETEDQLKSVAEIKKDMESPKVMDRLLCGDVGFGKTEVALRAIFKAVLDNKQVAFLAPTTILSQQHFNTCKARFDAFGVRVEVLNRFKTPSSVAKILNDVAQGRIDVLCGTHRLLSDDVNFRDLGLVVLDEEQKFGVEDKEKLKTKYPLVDFLTLSATPIPRTLHMSLSGIRDVSIISTPPSERLPVQTSVCEFSESLVRDACMRELARGGQVFILNNRVENIYGFAERIQKIVPEARVLVAHGQLSSKELENIIYQFYKHEGDILICTTIIENGIDIENVNTLIVIDSERFGLSQLYQIRGRVGRGNRTAYAYFTYKYDKVLSEEAYKRLEAISEFTEFGSGFKIAMRDLEIRGGGNVLGPEQHGFMQKVGYDMYAKLLANAVAEIKGEKVEEKKDTLMRISIDAFIPSMYIIEPANRMTTYKNISAIASRDEKERLESDLKDAFGTLPQEVINLIDIAYAKSMAQKLNAVEVVSTSAGIRIIFEKPEDITGNPDIGEALYENRDNCALELGATPMVKIKAASGNRESLDRLLGFLITATSKKR